MTAAVQPITRREHAFWMLAQLAPESAATHLTVAFRTRGALRWWPLQAAANHVCARHPALRSRFPVFDGVPVREVWPPSEDAVTVDVVAAAGADLADTVGVLLRRPFDLAVDAPLRVTLVQLADGGSAVVVTVHHIVADGASLAVITAELAAAYDALADDAEPQLGPVPADTAVPGPSGSDIAYWLDQLRDVRPAGMELPWGGARPVRPTFAGRTLMLPMPASTAAAVDRLRRKLRSTENLILLSAFYLALFRHGTAEDMVVGVPMTTREQAARTAVGYRFSTVPLRVRVEPGTGFGQLARDVRDRFLGGLAHAGASIEDILPELGHRTADWRTPIFRHQFNYRPWDESDIVVDGERPEFLEVLREESRLDIDISVVGAARPPLFGVTFSTEVHRESDIRAFVERMCVLLESADEDPDRPVTALVMTTPRERAVIAASNDTEDPGAVRQTVPERIRAWARRSGSAPAIITDEGERGYADLLADAARVAAALRSSGVRRGDTVAVAVDRGPAAAAAMIGAWEAGAAFLPLDPGAPPKRLAFQVRDSGARVVLCAGDEPAGWAGDVPVLRAEETAAIPPGPPGPVPAATDPAYLMYTSGSTGVPKAVRVAHGNLANVVASFAGLLGLAPRDATLWSTSPTFDISLLELFLPLTTGGRLVVAGPVTGGGAERLVDRVAAHDVRVVQATPTVWRMIVAVAGDRLRGVTAISGGEPLTTDLAAALINAGCRVLNAYGPTETTIWSTVAEITKAGDDAVTIGRPIANTTVLVVDRYGEDLGCGLTGELCVAGAGVSDGYPQRPELTAERFGFHPRHGRFYRTGDLARRRADGTLECLGRADRQVKVRGHRIELGEVEAVLAEHPEVAEAAAVVIGDETDGRELRAYVVPAGGADTGNLPERLWEHLRASLPAGALPSGIVAVPGLPVMTSGKLDYVALARTAVPVAPRRSAAPDRADADPELVGRLTDLWRDCLGRPGLGPDDNLFLNGGHSVLAAELAHRVARLVARPVELRAVFDHPTPRRLASVLAEGAGDD